MGHFYPTLLQLIQDAIEIKYLKVYLYTQKILFKNYPIYSFGESPFQDKKIIL